MGGPDLSLNLGRLYEQFQALCKTQIDLSLMAKRRHLAERLLRRYPDPAVLLSQARRTLATRVGLSDDELRQKNRYLEALKLDDENAALILALFVLENAGREYVEALLASPRRWT